MATYTDEQLQTAAARLREIYDVQTRAERLRTARRFGYESKPDSRLRIYRRLTRGKAKPFSRFSATEVRSERPRQRWRRDGSEWEGSALLILPEYAHRL